MDKKYTLSYLPTFEQDLADARDYIAVNLKNPLAACRLIEDTEKAIFYIGALFGEGYSAVTLNLYKYSQTYTI